MSDDAALIEVIVEEHDGAEPSGVEEEDSDPTQPQPWDPELIRVVTKHYTLREIVAMIDEKELDLAPDFQRNYVWGPKQKSRLIESILLRIPLPAFYFVAEGSDGTMRVVDGLQRLSTVYAFVQPDKAGSTFRLADLEYLTDEVGHTWEDMAPTWRRRLNGTQIVVHVIEPSTPELVKYDIFKRINTGGTPLNAQEIRHCMSGERSRAFLKLCAQADELDRATGGVLTNHRRMFDREVALRFAAFRMLGDTSRYREEFGSIEALLGWATRRLDHETTAAERDELYQAFTRSLRLAKSVFGSHAFRKWPIGTTARNPINRALFESWSVVLAEASEAAVMADRVRIRKDARDAMTRSTQYREAITSSTGDPARVAHRFEVARSIIDGTYG